MKLIRYLLGLSLFLLAGQWVKADETAAESFNPQKSIFEHLGDEYGWNVWNLHIPLPVIVRDEEGAWHVFSSAKLAGGQEYEGFYIAGEGEYEGKVIARDASGHIYRPWDFSVTKMYWPYLYVLYCFVGSSFHWSGGIRRNRMKRRGV